MINARAETVATAPAFRSAFKKTRCLIPASGFYEWQKRAEGNKQPMHIGMKDGEPFAFAGLWTRWGPKDGEQLETCTIITGEPNEVSASIHNRMPVILDAENFAFWLDPTNADLDGLEQLLVPAPADYARWLDVEQPGTEELLRPYPADAMAAYRVSTRVNSPKNDDAGVIDPR